MFQAVRVGRALGSGTVPSRVERKLSLEPRVGYLPAKFCH